MKNLIQNNLIIFCICIIIFVAFIGIGFASVTGLESIINATISATVQEGVFITKIEYYGQDDPDTGYNIGNYYNTTFNSTVNLSCTDLSKEVKFKIDIANNNDYSVYFKNSIPSIESITNNTLTQGIEYDNINILYKLTLANNTEVNENTSIAPNSTLSVYITFYYKSNVAPVCDISELNSTIKLNFVRHYTVHFNSNGGTEVNDIEVAAGDTISNIPTSTRLLFTFIGWQDSNGEYLTPNTVINSDKVYTASWGNLGNTVSFDSQGGSPINPIFVTYGRNIGSKVSSLPVPVKAGYEFLGWYRSNYGNMEKLTLNTVIYTSVTYYALWKKVGPYNYDNGYIVVAEDLENNGDSSTLIFGNLGINIKAGKTIETLVSFNVDSSHIGQDMKLFQMGAYSSDVFTQDSTRWTYHNKQSRNKLISYNYSDYHDGIDYSINYNRTVTLKYIYSYYDTNSDGLVDKTLYYIYDISNGSEVLIDSGIHDGNIKEGEFSLANLNLENNFYGVYNYIKVKSYNNTASLLLNTPSNLEWTNVISNVNCDNNDLSWTPVVNGENIYIKPKRVIEIKLNFSWDIRNLIVSNNTLLFIGKNLSSINSLNNSTLTSAFGIILRNSTRLRIYPYLTNTDSVKVDNVRVSNNTIIITINYSAPTEIIYSITNELGESILYDESNNHVNSIKVQPRSNDYLFDYSGILELSNAYSNSIHGTYNSIDIRYYDQAN